MRIHHIGYLVKKMDKAVNSFVFLGYEITTPSTWDEGRKAYICFLKNGGYCVELICPSKESYMYSMLKNYRNMPYHLCYTCDDLEKSIAELKTQKFMLFKDPEDAPVIGSNARVAFMINSNSGMIELLEEK